MAGALERLVARTGRPHMFISVGKGGVGKTTFSILLSLALQERGRTLLASLDPARHLLGYLGLRRVGKPERIQEAGFTAVQYDIDTIAKKVAEDYARLLRQVMPGLTVVSLDGIVSAVKNAPGFEEEVYLSLLRGLAKSLGEEYDYIVIDTPPTGVTHRMLNLPRLYLLWLTHLYELRYKIVAMRYTIAKVLKQEFEPHDPVLDKLAELRGEYEGLAKLLRNPERAGLVLIATPEPLPVYEVKTSLRVARELGIRVEAIVVNRVLDAEMASKLGVAKTQQEALEEVKALECGGCEKLVIMHSSEPPKSLEGVKRLLGLVKDISEIT